ncbi:MAG: FGGY-family carbohydrate kinase [Spirochaetales bacterium]|nr:FGGY-family carbohydrate kinase [Spirochaetales bacterium]
MGRRGEVMSFVLGIDLGTTFFKFGIVDRDGALAGLGRVEPGIEKPQAGFCELPVSELWSAVAAGIEQACQAAGIGRDRIEAVSYASQANSFLLLDHDHRPLSPILLWPDRRAEPVDPGVRDLWARPDYLGATGMKLESPELAMAKLAWLRREAPALWKRTRQVMSISDYLTFGLSGQAQGDEATTALLGTWNASRREWWQPALSALGISPDWLSTPRPPGTRVGTTAGPMARRLGLSESAAFAVGSLDHHAAALGAGCGSLAAASESTGTVLACLTEVEEYRPGEGYCVGPSFQPGQHYRLAFDDNGAAALSWYRQRFAAELSLEELAAAARNVPPGCAGLRARPTADRYPLGKGFYLAAALGRPPAGVRALVGGAQGAGSSAGAGAADGSAGRERIDHSLHGWFARAIMESTALSLRELLARIGGGARPDRVVATGGGAQNDAWLQIKADLISATLVGTTSVEPACLGAGIMAATAAGWFRGVREAAGSWIRPRAVFAPDPRRREAYRECFPRPSGDS